MVNPADLLAIANAWKRASERHAELGQTDASNAMATCAETLVHYVADSGGLHSLMHESRAQREAGILTRLAWLSVGLLLGVLLSGA